MEPRFLKSIQEPWTHNKTIQKALESERIPDGQKAYLRGLKVKLPK